MLELTIPFVISAFIAGLLMFLAPCTLPLVPAYLAFISGVRPDDLRGASAHTARQRIMINGTAFTLGFSVIFIAFGVLVGLFGLYIGAFRELLTQIGGVFIIFFGLSMLGVFTIAPLMKKRAVQLPGALEPGRPMSAFLIGATFALGWTPCVGPVLASVLLLAATSATVLEGGLLLTVFSLGLSVPFLLTAFLYARASALIHRYAYVTKWVQLIGGVFLVCIGVLLLTNSFGLTVEYGYTLFNILGIDSLFNHL